MFSNFPTMILSAVILSLIISITTMAGFLYFLFKNRRIFNLTEKVISDKVIIPSSETNKLKEKTNTDLITFKKQAIEELESVAMKVSCEMKSMSSKLEKVLLSIDDEILKDKIEHLFLKQNDRFLKIVDHTKSIITDPDSTEKKYYSFKQMKETHLPKNIMELLLTGTMYSLQELIDELHDSENHIAACLKELSGLNIIDVIEEKGMNMRYKITEKGINYYLSNYD